MNTGGRYLIVIGVPECPGIGDMPVLDRVAGDVERVTELLTSPSQGYERVLADDIPLGTSSLQMEKALYMWFNEASRRDDDYVIVYFAGHGDASLNRFDEHCLLTSDALLNRPDTVFATAKFAPIFFGGKLQQKNVLLILDVCQAGHGSGDVLQRALGRSKVDDGGAGFWVLSSTSADSVAHDGPFVTALSAVLNDRHHIPDSDDAYLAPNDIVVAINRWFDDHRIQQRAECAMIRSRERTLFFRNPAHAPVREGEDDANRAMWRHAGSGADQPGSGEWHFSGRHAALAAIAAWLDSPAPARNALVVTGLPGSGKSALLGALLQDTEARQRRDFQVCLYAKDETLLTLTQKLAIALHCSAREPRQLIAELEMSERHTKIMIDGLDEAREALAIEVRLLHCLAGCHGIRLLVATRSRGKRVPLEDTAICLDLDAPPYFERGDLEHYIMARLRDRADAAHRTRALCDADIIALAQHIASAAGTSFLYAQLACRAVLRMDDRIDTSMAGWQTRVPMPKGIDDAYRLDFLRFDDIKRSRYLALLTALAYAQDQGLPLGTLWCAISNRLSGGNHNVEDLIQLTEDAGFYMHCRCENGLAVYRLFHQTLVDFLRARGADTGREAAFFSALVEYLLATQASLRLTQTTEPYVRHQFAAHAAAAGQLDRYLDDPDLLTTIIPADLLPFLPLATSPRGQVLAAAYKRCWHLLRFHQPIAFLCHFALACAEQGLNDAQLRINTVNRSASWLPLGVLGTAGRRSEVYARGDDTITALVLSTDMHGQPVAICGYETGRLAIVGLQSDDALLELPAPALPAESVASAGQVTVLETLHRNGDVLIAAVWGKSLLGLYIVSPADWTCRHQVLVRTEKVRALCFSERGGHPVLVCCSEDALAVRSIPYLTCLQSNAQASKGKMYDITAFRLAGRHLIGVANDTMRAGKRVDDTVLRIWDVEDLALQHAFGHEEMGLALSVHACLVGQRLWLLVMDKGGFSLFVDPSTGATSRYQRAQYRQSGEARGLGTIRHSSVIGDVTTLVSQLYDRLFLVTLRPAADGSDDVLVDYAPTELTLESTLSRITPDGVWLINAATRQLRAYRMDEVWDAGSAVRGDFLRYFSERQIRKSLRHGSLTYIGDHLGSVSCWSDAGRCLWQQPGPGHAIRGLVLSAVPAGPRLVAFMADGLVELRDPMSGECLSAFTLPGEVTSIALSTHGSTDLCFVCIGTYLNGTYFYAVRAWDLASATEIPTEIAPHPREDQPGAMRRFEFDSGDARHAFCMRDYLKTKRTACSAQIHDGSRLLVLCGGAYGEVRAFDFDSFDEVDFWRSNANVQDNAYVNVLTVTREADRITVVSGNDQGSICRHRMGKGGDTLIHTKAHIGLIGALVVLDGPQTIFVSGGIDGALKFWNSNLDLLDYIELGLPVKQLQVIGASELVVTTDAGIVHLQVDRERLMHR